MQLQQRRHRPSILRKNRNCLCPPQFRKGIQVAARGKGTGSKSFLEANEKDKGKQMTLFQIQPQLGLLVATQGWVKPRPQR